MKDHPQCPKCGSTNTKLRKTWDLIGGIRSKAFKVFLFDCGSCKTTFRKLEAI